MTDESVNRPEGDYLPVYYSEPAFSYEIDDLCNDMWKRGYKVCAMSSHSHAQMFLFIRKDWA